MFRSRISPVRRDRSPARAAALVAVFAATALTPQASSAAGSLSVTTDSHQAEAETSLTIKTSLTGYGAAVRQYGAQVTLPGALRIKFPAYGTSEQQCPAQPRTAAYSGITPGSFVFDPSGCPATAKIGTAKLGSATGSIYLVSESPLPVMGVYFDRGIGAPFGRRLDVSYNGTSSPTLRIAGLPNITTSGLTLSFDNPDRPTLSPKIWAWAQAGDSECVAAPKATGNAWTWPLAGPTATNVPLAPVTLQLSGCGMGFQAIAAPNQAGATTPLVLKTTLTGTGPDARQYGVRFDLPRSIAMRFPAFGTGSQMCSPSTLSAVSTGYSPGTRAFNPATCPATAKIGAASFGSATGSLYLVNTSPYATIAVAFTGGLATPYGRAVNWTFDEDGASSLTVMGLQNQVTSGLTFTFDNPARPGGLGNLWEFVQPEDPFCGYRDAYATIYTYPAAGTVATASSRRYSHVPLSGCVS